MFNRLFCLVLLISFSYSECDGYNEFQCTENETCEWIEDIEIGQCSQFDDDEFLQ